MNTNQTDKPVTGEGNAPRVMPSVLPEDDGRLVWPEDEGHPCNMADWSRFRQLANDWKAKAGEGTWDAAYVSTWTQCADELDALITESRAAGEGMIFKGKAKRK